MREEICAPRSAIFSGASTAARGRRCVARWEIRGEGEWEGNLRKVLGVERERVCGGRVSAVGADKADVVAAIFEIAERVEEKKIERRRRG